MKVAVIGAGAMGSFFAGMISKAGDEVWLVGRTSALIETIKKKGLLIEDGCQRLNIRFNTITSSPETIGIVDLVIIFVKACDTAEAIKDAAPVISKKTTVLTLQNGFGNIEEILKSVDEGQVIAGTTAHGATLIGYGHVKHAGSGETVLGAVGGSASARIPAVKELFDRAGISTRISEDINAVLWGKLIVNIGINPLTALMKIKNGSILKNPPLCNIMHEVVQEGAGVAGKMGIRLPFHDPVEQVENVCRSTSGNNSSMLQDVEAGRKTEIDQINGAVVACAEEVNFAVPVNRMLSTLVQAMEDIRGST